MFEIELIIYIKMDLALNNLERLICHKTKPNQTKHTHTHTHTHIYIYISLIEYRYFLSTYFFVNPFELPYWSYDIRQELVDKPSIISHFPSTFCPTLGHYLGRMYYKSDVTFVCTLLLCIVVLCSVYFSNLFL